MYIHCFTLLSQAPTSDLLSLPVKISLPAEMLRWKFYGAETAWNLNGEEAVEFPPSLDFDFAVRLELHGGRTGELGLLDPRFTIIVVMFQPTVYQTKNHDPGPFVLFAALYGK